MRRNNNAMTYQLAVGIVLLSIASQLSTGTQAQRSMVFEDRPMLVHEPLYMRQPELAYARPPKEHTISPPIHLYNAPGPELRDLVFSSDYEPQLTKESAERDRPVRGPRLLERLYRLSENSLDDDDDQQRQQPFNAEFKHSSKRNAQAGKDYMVPCHFKICYYGR